MTFILTHFTLLERPRPVQADSLVELTSSKSRRTMLDINKIAKSLDERRILLAASRRELEVLLQDVDAGATPPTAAKLSAAILDRRCSASIMESLELYKMLVIDPYVWAVQIKALSNLIRAQTRLAAEHQLIGALVEQLLTSVRKAGVH